MENTPLLSLVPLIAIRVDISMIALWLGHVSTDTTHVYLEADLNTKEQALRKLAESLEWQFPSILSRSAMFR